MTAETRTLEFHVSQPETGSLDVQVRSALRQLAAQRGDGAFVKLRIFAIGAAALDSARLAVGRELATTHASLPVLALVGVAGFPDSSQRVEIEATVAGRGTRNPDGVAFIAGLASPTGERTIAGLARVAREAGVPPENVQRISCFYELPEQAPAARAAIAATFREAEASFVMSYASSARPAIECEAVARLATPPADPVTTFNLPGGTPSPNYSHATLVATPTVIFAASQVAANASATALRDMFDRVRRAAGSAGGNLRDVVMGDNYWLTDASRDTLRLLRNENFGTTVPAATGVFFTALPGGGTAAIELVIAAGRRPAPPTPPPGGDGDGSRYFHPRQTVG